MFRSTLEFVRCPCCGGELSPEGSSESSKDMSSGMLRCRNCGTEFPILAGVAILVQDVHGYLLNHVKGISQIVSDSEIPRAFLEDYLEAKSEIQTEHIEEDLEAERVTSLYVMNHYLKAKGGWWKPKKGKGSALIDSLVRKYWDRGVFAAIDRQVRALAKKSGKVNTVELGCGVGGLYSVLKPCVKSYLGVDSSFASVALARHLALGARYPKKVRVPEDLLQGPVSREIKTARAKAGANVDFVVGDLDQPPLEKSRWDLSIALNAIDMLEDPSALPKLQHDVLRENGVAIQSCPYIWHPEVARQLRGRLPKKIDDSAGAAEWLYEQAGFKIQKREADVPWLFFKHVRQLEIYSVHLFVAQKSR